MICPLCEKPMIRGNIPAYFCPTCDVETDEEGLSHYVVPIPKNSYREHGDQIAKAIHEGNLDRFGYPSPEVHIGEDYKYTAVCEDTVVHFDGHRFFISIDRGPWEVYNYLPNYDDFV